MANKIKLLVTSIGSLVGQNILDVLEYPDYSRRDLVEVIGTNSLAASPNNFRCDRCYFVPNTATKEFESTFIEIISKESPDLILSGRDEDTERVASIVKSNFKNTVKSPYGSTNTLAYALDKWQTWKFTQRNGLPFAVTFVMKKSGGIDELKNFIDKYDYPIIAKPIRGFASKGVFYLRDWNDIKMFTQSDNYMFQEYLGDAELLKDYFTKIDGPTPLFAHAPNVFHHSCHTVISSDGEIDPIFISRNEHDSGVTIGFRKVDNKILEELTLNYARSLYKEGGWGPLTVQFREDKNGNWKAQEMNLRTNGNTFPRFIMGQDDLGLIARYTIPEFNFPIYKPPLSNSSFIIGKTLTGFVMKPENINELKKMSFWTQK